MNRYVRNIEYKVPFEFCKECKSFNPYHAEKICLKEDGCKEAVRLYKKYVKRGNDGDADVRIDERDKMRDQLILNICSHCDSHNAGCEGCPIIKDINEVFDEQQP